MAESIARGVVQSGILPPSRICTAVHSNPTRRLAFESFGVTVLPDNQAVLQFLPSLPLSALLWAYVYRLTSSHLWTGCVRQRCGHFLCEAPSWSVHSTLTHSSIFISYRIMSLVRNCLEFIELDSGMILQAYVLLRWFLIIALIGLRNQNWIDELRLMITAVPVSCSPLIRKCFWVSNSSEILVGSSLAHLCHFDCS